MCYYVRRTDAYYYKTNNHTGQRLKSALSSDFKIEGPQLALKILFLQIEHIELLFVKINSFNNFFLR